MANPWAGEVALTIDGQRQVLKLTLGALAEMEQALGADSLVDLAGRFDEARFSSRDVLAVVLAGLRGGGWTGQPGALLTAEIEGGPLAAARAAAQLLALSFAPPSGP